MDIAGDAERDDVNSWPVAASALRHVNSLSKGPPVDPELRVTVHFHPDRLVGRRSLLEHLAADGLYRSQFETSTSNGGLTAHEGGERWRWEHRMFGGAYDGRPSHERPKYGSLNHRRRREGGSVRFGSAHFRLASGVISRCTFCYPDSVFEPPAFGTAQRMSLIGVAEADDRDRLDDYIEAHLHGPLSLVRDVEAVILDPSYRDTEIERVAASLPFSLEWHQGFRLHVDELAQQADYRGREVVEVGRAVAVEGWLDARVIGIAVRTGRYDEQTLKRLWHCTARSGAPAPTSAASG